MTSKNLNRLKVVLAEKEKRNKWLAKELGKNQTTISQWCNNARQPSIETLAKIADILDVDIKQLLNSTK